MAIEFHCPYCTSAIRVPDHHAGKKGDCPSCGTKLRVPAPQMPHGSTSEPLLPAASTKLNDGQPDAPDPPTIPPSAESRETPQLTSDRQTMRANEAEIPQIMTPAPPSMARLLKKKRRRSRKQQLSRLGIPAVCLILFFGTLAVFVRTRSPEMHGTLTGVNAGPVALPAAEVAVGTLGLDPESQQALITALEKSPETFLSDQLTCRIGSSAQNVSIRIQPGEGYAWFAVNPSGNPAVAIWLRQNRGRMNQLRLKQLQESGLLFGKDKLLSDAGQTVVFDAIRYRDEFGLNAHCDALGFAVSAVFTKGGDSLFEARCARQDRSSGTLYFSLPKQTISFTLRGRRFEDGTTPFPGEFTVTIPPDMPLEQNPEAAAPEVVDSEESSEVPGVGMESGSADMDADDAKSVDQ